MAMQSKQAGKGRIITLAAFVAGLAVGVPTGCWIERVTPPSTTVAPAGPADGAASRPAAPATSRRPDSWAEPVALPGAPSLHKVSDALYRGAQPTAEGFRQLALRGIKTVVNLRSFNSDRDEIGDLPLAYEHIKMKAWHAEDEDIVRFLRIVADPTRPPVFVHCQHGADRTGTAVAVYRIIVQGWTKDQAIEEMIQGGFGFHSQWKNLPIYLRNLDVDEIKRRAGL